MTGLHPSAGTDLEEVLDPSASTDLEEVLDPSAGIDVEEVLDDWSISQCRHRSGGGAG